MINEAGRGDERQILRRFLGLRLGWWLVLALWVLPHPTLAQSPTAFNQGVAYTISWFYAAAFDRTPVPNSTLPDYGDLGGLAFWTDAYLTGAGGLAPYRENVYAIADFFVTSDEFQARYPASLTNAAFITALYQNMLGREPDLEGFAFWVERLSTGASRGTVLADFTNTPENRDSNPLRKEAMQSFIALLAAHDGGVTPAQAAAWLAANPTLDGARVDGAITTSRLTVTRTGTGAGTVTSTPAGINCGNTCVADFALETTVTLTATPASGSTFSGWSGACSGAICQVTMSQGRNVTATFASESPTVQALVNINLPRVQIQNLQLVTLIEEGVKASKSTSVTVPEDTVSLVFLTDSADNIAGVGISQGDGSGVAIDATSTAIGLVMMVPGGWADFGISTAELGTVIRNVSSFNALVTLIAAKQQTNPTGLADDSQIT